MSQWVILWSDGLFFVLLFVLFLSIFLLRKQPQFRQSARAILSRPVGMVTLIILIFYVAVTFLDSVHYRVDSSESQQILGVSSLLDKAFGDLSQATEKSYSAPFSIHSYSKSMTINDKGQEERGYARLNYGGHALQSPQQKSFDIIKRIAWGFLLGALTAIIFIAFWLAILSRTHRKSYGKIIRQVFENKTTLAWRAGMISFFLAMVVIAVLVSLASGYHILGTDKVGQDVFYQSIKSIRTGVLIGTLTTLCMLPFALVLGLLAGYFSGWVDDIIQFVYTTLSSIPGVLLIAASILALQVFVANHTNFFPSLLARADARLLALCVILGITSWTTLCRLLRGETLKLHQQEFIQAARCQGVSHFKILSRHILPNVLHIIIITLVLDFSGLVLAEAVLSYVGVGVDPTTMSWGNMINSARLEFAREPIVWWPLVAAFIWMFILVLSANLFADITRDAFDPRLRNSDR